MLHVALLGRFEVRLNDEPIDVRLKPVQLLLAYLLLHRKKKIRREKLAGILWPDYTDASARKNLRNSIYRLRRAIGESFLVVDRTSVIFNTAAPFQLDVAQLQNMGAGGEIEELLYAAGLYQGELLPGSYEDWIVRERERVQADFERLMHKLLDQLVAAQRWEEVLIWSEHWIAQGQVPEPAYRSLMCAFAALGDRSSLAQTHRRVTQTLHNELGVAPGRRTQHLYRKLLAAEAVDADPLEEVHGAGVIEELATAGRMKLPLPATPMIGRRQELMQLQELITGAENGRLVCIVGPGGIGKSRLALETAKETAAHFADGARFVPLAAINNAQDLVTTISDHVGFTHSASDDPRQGLLNYLQRKKLLLILDNFEHLLSYADIVTDILQHALQVKLLCTSRERLNLDAEAVYMLSGLDYPVPEQPTNREPAQYGAIQLFLMRAALVQPDLRVQGADLDPVVRICHLVQGMPLALILAAGWLQMLTIEEVADEIASSLDILHSMARDLPQRQRSVRATFEYSWRLLSENDRHAFSRLALFRGGFSRQAAQHIASAPLPRLRRLVEKSLVVVAGPDRYQVHELLRQFAEEKLVAAGNDRLLRSTHSHYYLGEVAARVEEIKGKRQLESLAEIEIDIDNVRAAWEWALITEDWQSIDQAQESLSLFYYIQGRNREGYLSFRRVLESEPLSHSRSAYLDQIWGRLTARSGLLQSQLSAPDPELERELQDSLVVAQTHGLEREIAFGYLALGHYHTKVSGEYREALPCFEQAVDRYRALGDDYYLAHALHRLGYTHSY
ncbi:MAG: BTAD domain-containing putative transcriptional regulator, partial [Candidatus Promineifilaceae bacterium]|nr:BTAD domain-containing putative transcriptional regulator [Candidatus Promineifilaceae bacterium]